MNTKDEILLRRRAALLNESSDEPIPVQWVKNPNYATIDTGIIVEEGMEFEIKFQLQNNNTQTILGAIQGDGLFDLALVYSMSNNGFQTQIGVSGEYVLAPTASGYVTTVHTAYISYQNGTMSLRIDNGNPYIRQSTDISSNRTRTLYLFDRNSPYSNSYSSATIYYMKARKNGQLILDLVPVRKNNIGYLKDTLTNNLYGSITSTNLIYG